MLNAIGLRASNGRRIENPCFPLSPGDYVAGPFMVRQAHHERTTRQQKAITLAVRPERVEGRTANDDTAS